MIERKIKLIYIVSALLIIGFLTTSLASYFVSRSSLRSEITLNRLPLTGDNIFSEIQRDLIPPVFISSLMANDTFLRDWVIQGEGNENQIIRYLNEIQSKYSTFTCFFVSEKTRIYYQSKGILKKVHPGEERDSWYFRVRDMKNLYEINVDPDMANRDAITIFINYKVFDYSGNYIGATGVGLTVFAVKKIIDSYQSRYGRNIYFINKRGDIILSGSKSAGNSKTIHNIKGLDVISGEITGSDNGSFRYERDGMNYFLITRYIPEFQWHLLVEQSDEETIKTIYDALVLNLLLCAIITAVVLIITNLTISSYQKRLEKMATTDKLTGIHNRQSFEIIFSQEQKEYARTKEPMSIIMFDIDFFKTINDNFGHLAGDHVLKVVTETAGRLLRKSDILCRWGGEEFIILLKNCPFDNAFNTAENLRNGIKNEVVKFEDKEIRTTISLGVTEYRYPEDFDAFLARSDKACYMAKHQGRDRVGKC